MIVNCKKKFAIFFSFFLHLEVYSKFLSKTCMNTWFWRDYIEFWRENATCLLLWKSTCYIANFLRFKTENNNSKKTFQVFWLSNCYNKSYATYVLEFRGYEFSKLSTFPKCEFCQKEAKYSKSMEWENLNSKSRNPVGNFGQKPQSNFQLTALWWNGSIAK